jgi:hypothetical protein
MTTLLDSRLSDRDFASHLLHVDDLLTWAKSKRLHLPTVPPIDVHEFVQVEALLFGIERDASNVTPEQALNIVLNDQVLKNDPVIQKYPDDIDPITCRWLLGVVAHRKWRELLSGAIAAHELELLDFGSKLPVNLAPTKNAATPAPSKPATGGIKSSKAGPLSLTTGDIAFCFAGLRWKTETKWKKPLGDKPKWLAACIVEAAVRGVSETRWNPVCIGAALVRDGHGKVNSVRAKFQTQPLLKPWLDEWKTYEADNLSADLNTVRTPGVNPGF